MRAKFNIARSERKEFVRTVSEFLGKKSVYQGMPSAAYKVDGFTITKTGYLEWEEKDKAAAERLIDYLIGQGYVTDYEISKEDLSYSDIKPDLFISMPRAKFTDEAIDNLNNLIKGKGELLKQAFQVEELPIEIEDDKINFPWFRVISPEYTNAYMTFIQAICDMAINQKRISSKEKEVVNAKYEFRCFLLRLGFIGDEYKAIRKILLSNLKGSSAFKNDGKAGE